MLRVVDRETDRLDALVANLLDMSRIEAGVLRAHLETVDLAETITPRSTRRPCGGRACPIETAVDGARHRDRRPGPAAARAVEPRWTTRRGRRRDRRRGARSRSAVGKRGERLAVRVIDHGAGPGPRDARRRSSCRSLAWTSGPPSSGPASGSRSRKGFVDLMGGELWLEDTPGGGATFAFSLREPA